MATSDAPEPITALVDEIIVLNGRLLAAGDELAGAVGLTAARWLVLGALADGPITAAALARKRGLRRQSVQETVNRLVAEGFVARAADPDDRRAPLLHLTATARDTLARLEPLRAAWARRIGDAVDPGELAAALDVLRAVRAALDADRSSRTDLPAG